MSVLFCDLVGFTAASESADPEEVQARIAPYHARTRDRIEAYGGRVEKFIGDAVMAVFGAPTAHEDDPERAVRAGLALLEELEPLDLSVRIGVNTGEAVVSLDVRPELGEAMVAGDVVNTAARIQSQAPVNGVAVGEATFRATERVFEYEPLDPIDAKGKAEPVAVWRALRPTARFGSDVIRSMTTPLVGRELDFTLLRGTFDKAVAERSAQLVTVAGEPGVGKSRLVAELFNYTDGLDELVTWRQGRCLPYGEGITFWALGEIVKAHAGVFESDSPEVATEKLDAVLPESDDLPWLRARLLPLIGIDAGEPAAQEELFTAWRRFLESVAERSPLVLVVEDVHWADPALLAFLEHLADWAQGVPLLVACTARPELYETHAAWGTGLRNHTAINLSPLSDTDTAKLVSVLLERAVLPAETQQLLLERAGGNPLYAEEFVRMLRDRDFGADVPVPDSIHVVDRRPPRHASPGAQGAAPRCSRLGEGVLGRRGCRDGRSRSPRGRAGAARARAQGAGPTVAAVVDGRRGGVRVLAPARTGRRLPADPACAARSQAPCGRELAGDESRRAGRGARIPHRRGAHPRPGGRRRRPRGRGNAPCCPLRPARRRANDRPRRRQGAGSARAGEGAHARGRSGLPARPAALGRGRPRSRPLARGGRRARAGAWPLRGGRRRAACR